MYVNGNGDVGSNNTLNAAPSRTPYMMMMMMMMVMMMMMLPR